MGRPMAAAQETERLRAKPNRLAQVTPNIPVACLGLRIQEEVLAKKHGSEKFCLIGIEISADKRARAEVHGLQ